MGQGQTAQHSSQWRGYILLFAGLLALYLLVGAYSLIMLDSVRGQAEKENLAATAAQARQGAFFVADHQQGLLTRLSAIVSRNSVRQAMRDRDLETLRNYMLPVFQSSREIIGAILFDAQGKVMLAQPEGEYGEDKAEVLAPSCPAPSAKPAISPVVRILDEKCVALSAPALDRTGRCLGRMAVLQSPVLWQRYFSNLAARPGRSFYLFDQSGTLVAAGPGAGPLHNEAMAAYARRVSREIKPGGVPISSLDRLAADGHQAFVSAAAVGAHGWGLLVVQDYALAMAPTLALSRNIWLFLLVLLLCQVIMGFLLASRYRMQQRALIKTGGQARRLEAEVEERTADLKALTERYRTLLQDLPDIVYEADSKGCITLVSGAAKSVLGCDPTEMIGRPLRSYMMPADRHKFDEERSRAEHGQTMSILALRFLPKQGPPRWLSIHSRGVTDGQGRLVGRRGVARDVTQQVLAEMQVHELSGKLINAQEEERKRLAMDLHDELGQLLSALKIGLQSLGQDVPPEQARELERLTRLSQTVMDRVRALAYNLRPAILDSFGLVAAVQDLCDSLDESGLLHVKCRLGDVEARLPSSIKLPLFRCVQEALHNVIKHSGSAQAVVNMDCYGNEVRLTVSDEGKGFDPQKVQETSHGGRYLGLLGMRERLRLIGGRLLVDSSPQGTTIIAKAPLEQDNEA